jgi:hypothetical protein
VHWRLGLAGSIERAGDSVTVAAGGRTLTLPAVCEPALRALLLGASTRLDALPGLDEADAIVVCRRLVREGVLVLEA